MFISRPARWLCCLKPQVDIWLCIHHTLSHVIVILNSLQPKCELTFISALFVLWYMMVYIHLSRLKTVF